QRHVAAGGAFLSIPLLSRCNVPLKRAIGTAAAIGFPIAVAGTVGYVTQGLRASGLPDWSLGYVYLPALAIIVAISMPLAPLGARLAHRLPLKPLRILFALTLLALALRMAWTV
ncbi:MAG: sulfite exporter TauE/SafE family protein, partial [Betaproteobacteria bacterium]|nr:sulfite exporter TauE/SafE family protein [Betaproteobacteria bacterium]